MIHSSTIHDQSIDTVAMDYKELHGIVHEK